MLKRIWNALLGIEHSVEHILSDFTNKVRELEKHAEQKLAQMAEHEEQALEAQRKLAMAGAEATKATAVADKIRALLAQ